MRRRGLLAALLLAAAAAPSPAQDPSTKAGPPQGSRVDPALQKKVDAAIARGVEWLRTKQADDGAFGDHSLIPVDGVPPTVKDEIAQSNEIYRYGETALALYTLRACGATFEDPQVARGFEFLRKDYLRRKGKRSLDNYGVSLTVLALEAHYAPPPPAEGDSDRYGRSVQPVPGIPAPDLAWLRELTAWLVAAQDSQGGFGYVSPGRGGHDHSNSQYSLLALKAARRCGIPVPARLWLKALHHFLDAQERKGPEVVRRERKEGGGDAYGPTTSAAGRDRARGWGYGDGDPATGSMTSGGVSSLAICREECRGKQGFTGQDDAQAERGIRDGIAWLGLHFTVKENPGPKDAPMGREMWQYYYIYGLERAGILAGVAMMADHDWYREGAEYLVENQAQEGSWAQRDVIPGNLLPPGARIISGGGSLQESCWALLFLKRATARLARGTATGDTIELEGSADLGDREFRILFDRVFARFAEADAKGRDALVGDFVRMGVRSIPHLVRRLDDADTDARAAALEALRRTTGETLGFDPAAPEEARAAAAVRWEEWWGARRERLAPDPAAGKFVEKPR